MLPEEPARELASVARLGLARRDQGARRRRCRCASATTSNAEIDRNPQAPFGFRRRGAVCGVGAARRCSAASPASRRLTYSPTALGTQLMLILGRAPKPCILSLSKE